MDEKFRILLVDDHDEIRQALRANLEALEVDIQLIDVPSGEDAILEVVGTGVDLLIADIGLPGLSGLELFTRLKNTYPKMQVILMTGLEDEDIRKQIAETDADAFFYKPIQMPEFMNAVRKTLGLEPVVYHTGQLPRIVKKPLDSRVTERISDLRGELGAISVLVVEETGVIAGETGIIPDSVYESRIVPLLLMSFQTTSQIATYLDSSNPGGVWYFSGEDNALFWSHIDRSYGMLVITNSVTQKTDLPWVLTMLELAVKETQDIICEISGKTKVQKKENISAGKKISTNQKKSLEKAETRRKESSDKIDISDKLPEENEVHEFWKTATLETEILRIESEDSLSYEQAQQLGLTPREK